MLPSAFRQKTVNLAASGTIHRLVLAARGSNLKLKLGPIPSTGGARLTGNKTQPHLRPTEPHRAVWMREQGLPMAVPVATSPREGSPWETGGEAERVKRLLPRARPSAHRALGSS